MGSMGPRRSLWLAVAASLLVACSPVDGSGAAQDGISSPVAVEAAQATTLPSPDASSTEPAAVSGPRTASAAAPTPPATPAPLRQPFALNLYRDGDFVPQYTFDWCVAASIQMAHNLIDDTSGGTWADRSQQGELWEMARARSSDSFNGANPYGWAEVLTASGLGPYSVVSVADYNEALQTAARAIAETGRPVGLVMWSGRHAWVMSGFESLGDPSVFPDFQVTGVRVLDPLYPYGSGQWGPSPEPNSLLSPEQLATQFVVREPRRWSSSLPAGYLLVLPGPAS
ncbi:hypothetical protein GA0061083_1666 [Pseudarthrobacter enclensis]|uniref:Peptidase C39-like domain-containing protein n=1 Tax=Pseudarthrobacter enclensis TaxID=993070 RepID=A0A0V8ISM6_9MICC|nr:hypothetical protein AS031_06750 [Pseudarthrobacter enclensis]SCB93886.1 hypothetical protein GA0061083_1666 [Pseudarthrobacter enclensis]